MIRDQQHATVSGRYTRISHPLGSWQNWSDESAGTGQLVISVHGQTVFFILIAVMVGAGLLMIVPNFSAAASNVAGTVDSEVALESVNVSPDVSSDSSSPEIDSATVPPSSGEQVAAASGSISPVFTREVRYWESKISEWSKMYNLDPDIIATIMQIESCGDPGAASHAGAQGLFQVMPFHFDAGEDMLDPDTNARRGMAFYNRQLEYTGWDIYLSFAGYNGGYAASGSSYPYWANETQRYFTWAKGIYDDAKAGLQDSPTLQQWLDAGGGSGCHRAAQRLGL